MKAPKRGRPLRASRPRGPRRAKKRDPAMLVAVLSALAALCGEWRLG